MDRKIFAYCERGLDPSFWAEPLNAVTNAGFIVAAFLAFRLLSSETAPGRAFLSGLLIALMTAIGIGSFLFHTYAEPWAGAADTIPILLFMLTAVYALGYRLVGLPWWGALLGVAGFMGLMVGAFQFRDSALVGVIGGSIGYTPAALVLIAAGLGLTYARNAVGPIVALAGVVFIVSLTARTVDQPLCPWWTAGGARLGTHFLWHLLNAVTLYLVARALITGRASFGPRAALA